MLINRAEYEAMYQVEEQLWWYKILHERVYEAIKAEFGDKTDIKILDAGCGTGGMLSFLAAKGYKQIQGFDFNDAAVEFSKNRGLHVSQASILELKGMFETDGFDVVICNDVLYQFEDEEIKNALLDILSLLKPNGKFISNNNAFEAFRGTHDIAVGSKKRFVLADFKKYLGAQKIVKATYWSFFLSPLIFLVRFVQRLQLRFGKVNLAEIKSDVSLPSPFLNSFFYRLVKFESRLSSNFPFGSSLFLIITKN